MNKYASSVSLWSIVERLQRRLEGRGLPRDAVDAMVSHAIWQALHKPGR
jgi:hypothetical protein